MTIINVVDGQTRPAVAETWPLANFLFLFFLKKNLAAAGQVFSWSKRFFKGAARSGRGWPDLAGCGKIWPCRHVRLRDQIYVRVTGSGVPAARFVWRGRAADFGRGV